MRHRTLPFLLAAFLLPIACGSVDEEAALREASERVAERQGWVDAATLELEGAEEALASAEEDRERAQQALRDAERRLTAAEGEVAEFASDEVLFRTVQRRLLEDEALEDVAISAIVHERVVVLRGSVSDPELRERAIAVARETPGVESVESRIKVPSPPPVAAPQPEAAQSTE